MKREKIWNPKVKKCIKCSNLKPLVDKQSKSIDANKKLCEKWGWEISNELAAKQAVCMIVFTRRKRK